MFQFQKPKNELEAFLRSGTKTAPSVPNEMFIRCPECKASLLAEELAEQNSVCTKCGFHFKMNARERLHFICDENTFVELFEALESDNILDFPDYDEKLGHARRQSAEKDAVVTGSALIGGHPCAIFVMDSNFMMGSMGRVVGEKIALLFEHAIAKKLPVVGFTVSGGARMQEGILSLMQMAKTSGAVKKHSDAGLFYITVLTNPTTGGVTASFAMEGDIILSEPGALICFAGPRVIEQTTNQKLPQGFQRAEFLLDKGFVDAIVPRVHQKSYLSKLLLFHKEGAK